MNSQQELQRAMSRLCRWYMDTAQAQRNWTADRCVDWHRLGTEHSPELLLIIEGFYAIEQFAPDYATELVGLTRSSYGPSGFLLRWASEEARHADVFRNVLLFSGGRSQRELDELTEQLRARRWRAPFNTPLHMLMYSILQERAAQLGYLKLANVAAGISIKPQFAADEDPVLARAARLVAMDETAHYEFFLEAARLHLTFEPEAALEALTEVVDRFGMPAADLIPNYAAFVEALQQGALFGRSAYSRDVVPRTLEALGVEAKAALPAGLDQVTLRSGVARTLARLQRFEDELGLGQ